MFDPISTYRIQFHKGFNFSAFEKIIPYLEKLGIKTIYASPIFTAVPGSTHGYDIANPHSINPEIGTLEQLYSISGKLKNAGMAWLQDIVPNHMAMHPSNQWLMDVLEHGRDSAYARYFDIDWGHPAFGQKVMVPFLDAPLEEALAQKKAQFVVHDKKIALQCSGITLPANFSSWRTVFAGEEAGQHGKQLLSLYEAGESSFLAAFAEMLNDNNFAESLQGRLENINSNAALLMEIIGQQHYTLCPSQDANQAINYRRFFTISGLIGLNMQDEQVFEDYHSFIKTLCADDIFQGLRIDHIDGLPDPGQYVGRLRELVGEDIYIVAEKILGPNERTPAAWPLAGTTGYDFLGMVNNLLAPAPAQKKFLEYYNKNEKQQRDVPRLLHEKKSLILYNYMQGELDNLYKLAIRSKLVDKEALRAVTPEVFKKAIGEFLIQCPVYRYYGAALPLGEEEEAAVNELIGRIGKYDKSLAAGATLLKDIFLTRPKKKDSAYNGRAAAFYRRCMQFSGPLMAKGVEDTLMYTLNYFIAHNEVGNSPLELGCPIDGFHQAMKERLEHNPMALNATSTHDTKRGEDARARLNALPGLGDEWIALVQQWRKMNGKAITNGEPGFNMEYFIYQSLIGSYPLEIKEEESFKERFKAFMQKALREAKEHTTWDEPNTGYEGNTQQFIDNLFNKKAFTDSARSLLRAIGEAATTNSLAQVLLKFTCPGIPDIYQGDELWDFSMADPDNRRPVDYELRERLLDELMESPAALPKLWKASGNGKIKLLLAHTLLKERKEHADAFASGSYEPLQVTGAYKKYIIAYARKHKQTCYIIAIAINALEIARGQGTQITGINWKDTEIILPGLVNARLHNLLAGQETANNKSLPAKELFAELPVAIIKAHLPENKRGCGILLPVFSLPSRSGVGDFGPGAYRFVDFLRNSGQKYWQLLPLNPVKAGQGYSPYNSTSGMACNTLFISPAMLAEEGLLDSAALKASQLPLRNKIDYAGCETVKNKLYSIAYHNFVQSRPTALHREFTQYCNRQAYWLDDYALYVTLQEQFNGEPWFKWPDAYKRRKEKNIAEFAERKQAELQMAKWLQFIAESQWKKVRGYCNNNGVSLIGDMPFYMSLDSVDVWANPEKFCIGKNGEIKGIAGVPPDYFSKTGQLWNMPTYNWNALKTCKYEWWISRLRRNLEFFDKVRLDHFRAFEAYWQVPAGAKTAEKGEWKKGPGMDFFDTVREAIGGLPFIAEDLGDNMEDVYALRRASGLPGMKVLQFAWGENMPVAVDAPHNHPGHCIVYTGTHDNNTTIGWFRQEAKKADKRRLEAYTGLQVNEENINAVMIRIAYSSVAETAIIPMQDILGYGQQSRMNTPGTSEGNWLFRLPEKELSPALEKKLKQLAALYNRWP